MRDAHQLLHHFRRGGDLGAADGAVQRFRQPVIGLLPGIGLDERARPQFLRKVLVRRTPLPRVPHPLRHRVGAIALVHVFPFEAQPYSHIDAAAASAQHGVKRNEAGYQWNRRLFARFRGAQPRSLSPNRQR
jgi:hypothetical protein